MGIGEIISEGAFLFLAAISVLCAVIVVTRKNPIYSAFFLIACLISIELLFITLDSTFIAGMHILVYVGAIMVLFLFTIMLLNLRPEELGHEYSPIVRGLTAFICAIIFALLVVVFISEKEPIKAKLNDFSSVEKVGTAMFRDFILPFELVSILIIIAIVGAVVLVRKS